jgi:integrase
MARLRETNKHLPKYVTIVHGSYWFRPPNGESVKVCRVGDEAELYGFMAKLHTPTGPMTTLNDCFDRYERDVIPTLEPRTQKDYRRHLLILRKEFGHRDPNDIQPKDIGRFLDVDKGRIQRNRVVAVLSAVFTKAVGRWYVADRNPCTAVERNPSKRRSRNVLDAEYAGVYAVASPRLRVAMDLALLTGQRQGDLLKMKWKDVTPEGWTMRQGKTGKRLLISFKKTVIGPDGPVEVDSEIVEVLQRARAFLPHLPREYVLRNRKGRPYTENGFRAIWQAAMRRYEKTGGERFTFHDLRGKSATDSASLQDAYERLGHTNIAMTRGVYDRGVRKVKTLK